MTILGSGLRSIKNRNLYYINRSSVFARTIKNTSIFLQFFDVFTQNFIMSLFVLCLILELMVQLKGFYGKIL